MAEHTFFRKSDWAVLTLLLLLGIGLLVYFKSRPQALVAQVYADNRLVAEIPLDREGEYRFEACPGIVFQVQSGRIRFAESDCPDQICVRSSWLSSAGECAVCLPHKTVLMLRAPNEPDAVVFIRLPQKGA